MVTNLVNPQDKETSCQTTGKLALAALVINSSFTAGIVTRVSGMLPTLYSRCLQADQYLQIHGQQVAHIACMYALLCSCVTQSHIACWGLYVAPICVTHDHYQSDFFVLCEFQQPIVYKMHNHISIVFITEANCLFSDINNCRSNEIISTISNFKSSQALKKTSPEKIYVQVCRK